MDRLSAMAVFVAVADHGSFTAAAQAMAQSKAQVSKQIQALESHLGVRLLNRTTRRLHLTELGQRYLEDCRRLLAELDAAEALLTAGAATPRGLIRMTAPMTFGQLYLAPLLPILLDRYPELGLDLDLSDRMQNLVESGFDLALRIGRTEDSSLIGRQICRTHRLVLGSPGYLAARGRPERPEDLVRHVCLNFSYLERSREWRLRHPETGEDIVPRIGAGRLRANNGSVLAAAAAAGHGLVILPDFIAAAQIEDGSLVPILTSFQQEPLPVQILYPPGRLLTAGQRAVVDFLITQFRNPPWSRITGLDGHPAAGPDLLPDAAAAAPPV